MAKPSPELTVLRSKNAKELFSWWNSEHPEDKKSQGQLAKIMGKTKEVINAKLNGHRTLTLDDAKQIARYFPGVRYQYIMGEDDFKTDAELFEHFFSKTHEIYDTNIFIFQWFSKLKDYHVKLYDSGISEKEDGGYEDRYIIIKNNVKSLITYTEICNLIDDFSVLTEARLNRLLSKPQSKA